jgi:hypothetical protein
MGRLRRLLTMDANEAMEAVGARYLALFRRYPVRMRLVWVAGMAVLLILAWRVGGRGLLIAELIVWLGLVVIVTLVSLVAALLRRARRH